MSAPFRLPYRTAPDSLDAIRADLDDMLGRVARVEAEPDPTLGADAVEALCRKSRELFTRRALEEAAEHAAAMLPALGLPRLVGPGFVPVNPVAALDALDAAIAALDALDADPDLEEEPDDEAGGDDELSLGWREAVRQLDLGHGSDDGEHTLGAPERSPYAPPMGASFYKPANGRRLQRCFVGRVWNQTAWAAGANLDGEGEPEPGYDLPEGDDEKCGSEHDGCEPEEQEHSLGAPAGDGDQRHWAQGHENDREADPCDGSGLYLTAEQYRAARDRRPEMRALASRARAMRGEQGMRRDPDAVTPIGPGMVAWRGPMPRGICNVVPVEMPVRCAT
ncbi:hypothetical protein [Lichenibacterium dinghuense]|uniref:hypothetical protein n=1 Tax=Lichenibacterium dinghuense TaxID=2895977 RepID=UPI001F164FFD|nr:hypothetical protein [Lichenibacterium sp. 6Y81]